MQAWPFFPSRASKDAERLLLQVTNISRNPALFGEGRVPDTLDGRFELVGLYAALALVRLRQAPEAEPLAQAFVDALFRYFDSGLREDGVGDLAVPKRVHMLASAFYGRADAYAAAFADANTLQAVLTRNVLAGRPAFAEALARYVQTLADAQSKSNWQTLLLPEGWTAFVA